MRLSFFFLLYILCISTLKADEFDIDMRKLRVPDSLNTAKQITRFLIEDLDTDREKAKYIFTWITKNIDYDPHFVYAEDKVVSVQEVVDHALKTKSAVCQHYAILLKTMFEEAKIETHVILGIARRIDGPVLDVIHAWNAAKIGGEYLMLDPTFASGYIYENKYFRKFMPGYFLIDPRTFIETHIPFDPVYQFLDNPLSHLDFINANYDKLSIKGDYNYADTLASELKLRNYQRVELSNKRVMRAGVTNLQTALYLEENIILVAELKYSHVMNDLNNQIRIYRQYLRDKENGFLGYEDRYLKMLLKEIKRSLNADADLLKTIETKDELMANLLFSAKPKINRMIIAIKEEEKVLRKIFRKRKKAKD